MPTLSLDVTSTEGMTCAGIHGIFLDTSIVVCLDEYNYQVWEEAPVPDSAPPQLVRQIAALRVLMALAGRAP